MTKAQVVHTIGKGLGVPFGPYHPGLAEPMNFIFHVDGEKVVGMDFRLGYNNRGVEKLVESKDNIQAIHLVQHICGICSFCHSSAITQAMEEIIGVKPPMRALYIRSIMSELERIHSHMLWAGLAGDEIGFKSLLMYGMKEREHVMDCIELLVGNRVHYAINTIGGVRRDINEENKKFVLEKLDVIDKSVDYLISVLVKDPIVHKRTVGIGVLSHKEAVARGAVGPTARASNVPEDVRTHDPYMAYEELDFEVPVLKDGDVFARVVVRMLELKESIKMTRQALKEMPEGPIIEKYASIPAGETVNRVEAPRGEDIHYVKLAGGNKIDRVKIRAPTGANIWSLPAMFDNAHVADIPLIVASIDPCVSCMERVGFVEGGKMRVLTIRDLRKLRK